MKLSKQFCNALKIAGQPQYRLALSVGLNPSSLSRMVYGAQAVHSKDQRLSKLADKLGVLASEIFEKEVP